MEIWTIWFHIVRVLSTKESIVHVDRQIPIHVAIKWRLRRQSLSLKAYFMTEVSWPINPSILGQRVTRIKWKRKLMLLTNMEWPPLFIYLLSRRIIDYPSIRFKITRNYIQNYICFEFPLSPIFFQISFEIFHLPFLQITLIIRIFKILRAPKFYK